MFRTTVTLAGRQFVIGINFTFKSLKEFLACGPGACPSVLGPTPRDFGGDLLVTNMANELVDMVTQALSSNDATST